MIPLLVFYIHVLAVVTAFTKRFQDGGLPEGGLAVFFVALIFFVGWSISSFVIKLFVDDAGLGVLMNRDAISLLLLTAGEGVFYYFFFREDSSNE